MTEKSVKKLLLLFLMFISLIFILISSIENIVTETKVWIEAEDTKKITGQLEIINNSLASGGKALISRSESHVIESFALYNINIPFTSKYYMWARTFWPGSCNNSFLAGFNEEKIIYFGNDNILNLWHWIKVSDFELNKGVNKFYIWSDEKLSQLDKLLLTTNPYFIPKSEEENYAFYCDFENDIPKIITFFDNNLWSNKSEKDSSNIALHVKYLNKKKSEFAILDFNNYSDYYFSINVKSEDSTKKNNVFLIFNYKDRNNYYKINILGNNLMLSFLENGKEAILKKKNILLPLIGSYYKKLSIIHDANELVIKINGLTALKINDLCFPRGKIGFGSKTGGIYFDNLIYNNDLAPIFYENFFTINIDCMKKGNRTLKWNFYHGNWGLRNSCILSLEGQSIGDTSALITTGEEYWKNYSVTAAMYTKDSAGVCFYVMDNKNYYLLRIIKSNDDLGKVQLLKIEDGIEFILCEKRKKLIIEDWNKITVKTYNNHFSAFIDDYNILNITDSSLLSGSIGLWSKSENITFFDDIIVAPNKRNLSTKQNLEYEFEVRQKAGIDFCDWENSNKSFNQSHDIINVNKNISIYLNKELLEDVFIFNKKLVAGNIKLILNHYKEIPKDIDVNILLNSVNNNNKNYRFIIKSSGIVLIENKTKLKEKNIGIDRRFITMEYSQNSLKILSKGILVFKYNIIFDQKVKLGIGYSGIGKDKIKIRNIKMYSDSYSKSL